MRILPRPRLRPSRTLALERLEDRLAPALVNWTGGAGNFLWQDAANWDAGDLPAVGDDVEIGSGFSTDTVISDGAVSIQSLVSAAGLRLIGGTFLSDSLQSSQHVTIAGGTLQSPSVILSNGAALVGESGVLEGVTIDGNMDLTAPNSRLTVRNGLTLNGTATLGNAIGSTYGGLSFEGTQTFDGTATVILGKSGGNFLRTYNTTPNDPGADVLTIGAGITIRGSAGTIGDGRYGATIINQGTIIAEDGSGLNGFEYDAGVEFGLTRNTEAAIDTSGVSTPAPQSVYQTAHFGGGGPFTLNTFSYTLPNLTAGTPYTVRLHFAEIQDMAVGLRTFHVAINGTRVLTDFDIAAVAGGMNKAVVREFAATADASGQIIVTFQPIVPSGPNASWASTGAQINGIEILDGTTVVRAIDSGLVRGGTLTINPASFHNAGLIEFGSAQTLILGGAWHNDGSITASAGATLNLGGTFTVADIGTLNRTDTTVSITGTLENTGTTFDLASAIGGGLLFAGGTIRGGTVISTGLATLTGTPANGFLDNVTLDGNLDMTRSGSHLNVFNGLTLDGQVAMENSTLRFGGTQTLAGTGTIVFTGNGGDRVFTDQTLTIGPDITIRGAGGIGGAIVNQGTIIAEVPGRAITLVGPVQNQGVIQVVGGAGLNLSGEFIGSDLGTILAPGGGVVLGGTIDNRGNALALDASTGSWTMQYAGRIVGGTITTADGVKLIADGSNYYYRSLSGVTIDGDLEVTGGTELLIQDGLTVNGTLTMTDGTLNFINTPVLAGTGTIVLGGYVALSQPVLTIESGITIRGSGAFAYSMIINSDATIINRGTIASDTPGDNILLVGNWENEGTIVIADGSGIGAEGILRMNGQARLSGSPDGILSTTSDLLGNTQDAGRWVPPGTVQFVGGGTLATPQLFEVMGRDLGDIADGDHDNFNFGTLGIGSVDFGSNTYVLLVDLEDNSPGSGPEAVYVDSLIIPAGSTLDLNGLHLYAQNSQIDGSVVNGVLERAPQVRPLALGLLTRGEIEVVGAVDEWTFIGHTGESMTVRFDAQSTGLPPIHSPLAFAEVSLVDETGLVLASATDLDPTGAVLTLAGVVLPADGMYRVRVRAPAAQPSVAGDYRIGVTPASNPILFGLSTDHGGNTGKVTLNIAGANFGTGLLTAGLRATGLPEVVGTHVAVVDANTMTATFNLTAAVPGRRDVVVNLANGTTLTLPAAFMVENGGESHLWFEILGGAVARAGTPVTYQVVVGNSGTVDWDGLAFIAPSIPIASGPVTVRYGTALVGIFNPAAGSSVGLFNVPLLGPSQTAVVSFSFTPNLSGNMTFPIFELPSTGPLPIPAPRPGNPPLPPFPLPVDLGDAINDLLIRKFMERDIEPPELPEDFLDAFKSAIEDTLEEFLRRHSEIIQLSQNAELLRESVDPALAMLEDQFPGLVDRYREAWMELMSPENWDFVLGALLDNWRSLVPSDEVLKPVEVVASRDPNDKFGPVGVGVQQYIIVDEPLSYTILFENLPAATAPAQEVVITDQLDVANLDLSTFSFGPITFGDRTVIPPPGLKAFTTTVDLRPTNDLIVLINAQLDQVTGLITWRFTSIDPATGTLPLDPLAGFLPPNANPPEGDGSVLYTVMPKAGLPTGTEIRNRASIIFDTNAPIDTPEWFNTLDNASPTSQVLPLAAIQTSTQFAVQWAGTDLGAGVRNYTVFVSVDGGSFAPWLTNTTATSQTYAGQNGKTYRFYSVATDNVGLREAAPTTPDATITVSVPPRPTLVGEPQFAVGVDAGGAPQVRYLNQNGTVLSTRTVFDGGTTGGVRTAAADFNGDGVAELVVGTGPGVPTLVRILDGASGQEIFRVAPFEASFLGGVYVAAGDLTGDGVADLVITPDEGGGPRVLAFRGGDFTRIANFFGIDDKNFRGGARAAVGDVTGDGIADLIVSAGFGGGPRISIYDGQALTQNGQLIHPFADFFLFEPALRNGAFVAAGDLDADGFADVIGGGGPGGGPRVYALSGSELLSGRTKVLANFFAGNTANRGGIRVSAKNLDGDYHADIVVGDGSGAGSRVTAFFGKDFNGGGAPTAFVFDAFPGFTGGVFVG